MIYIYIYIYFTKIFLQVKKRQKCYTHDLHISTNSFNYKLLVILDWFLKLKTYFYYRLSNYDKSEKKPKRYIIL